MKITSVLFLTLTIAAGGCARGHTIAGTIALRMKGTIHIAVQSREEFLGERSTAFITLTPDEAAITDRKAEYRISGIPAGTYAIVAFQDSNGNGTLDMASGQPAEPFAIHRYQGGYPDFDSVAVKIEGNRKGIDLRLGM